MFLLVEFFQPKILASKIFPLSSMSSLFDELFPRGTNVTTPLDTMETQYIQQGYKFEIGHTWDGKAIEDHETIKGSMHWHFQRLPGQPHKRVIRVEIRAPLFDDPEPPTFTGPCQHLWDYECVELFFANDSGEYLEVEVGPHGHWLVLLHRAYRDCFNEGTDVELEVENCFKGNEWICRFEIPLAYLPGRVSKFNAYALHGENADRHFEALHAVSDGSLSQPDFHNLQYFGRIDMRRLVPDGYNRQPFNDFKYGNMWEDAQPAKS